MPAGLTRRGIRHLARVQVHTIHHDFGALMVGKEEPWELGSREQFVLTTLANQAAVALENARLRREIEEGVERLQALIQASPLAIIARDRDANIQMWNPASERMFGWTEEEVLGGRYPLVPEDRRKEFHESLERSQRGEALTGIETRRLRKDGALIDAAIWTAPLHDGGAMVIIADITARKRVEEALVDMASFAEMNPAPVLRLDQHGTILLVNPAARQLFGEPDLLGKSWYALCLESEPIALERVLQSNDTLQCETQVGERCLLFTHRASLDRGQVYVYGADITERKRAEEALRESEERARLIVESAQDAFICMDARGVITDWNPQAEATFGWPRSQAVGRLLAKTIIPPQHQEAHGRGLQHFLATGEGPVLNKRIELTALHRDGREFPVELTISAVQLGEAHIFHGFVHDISERKQAEEALRKSEEEFRSLFEDSRDAIYISAPDGKVLDVNQAALDLFGFTRDAAIGSDVGDRFVDPSDRERFRQEITTAGALRNFEVRLRKKNGSEMDCLLTATRRRAKNGGFAGGTQGIIHDITERKRAEEALRESETMLRQSEKMAQLGTLTAGVAHELNNPAAAVKSGAGQLEAAIAQFGQAQSQLSRLALTEAQQKTLQGLTQRASSRRLDLQSGMRSLVATARASWKPGWRGAGYQTPGNWRLR